MDLAIKSRFRAREALRNGWHDGSGLERPVRRSGCAAEGGGAKRPRDRAAASSVSQWHPNVNCFGETYFFHIFAVDEGSFCGLKERRCCAGLVWLGEVRKKSSFELSRPNAGSSAWLLLRISWHQATSTTPNVAT